MYEQKENLEKATQQAEQEYYQWRGLITENENEISSLRRKKDKHEVIENEFATSAIT
jgi:chromosome segregation protein